MRDSAVLILASAAAHVVGWAFSPLSPDGIFMLWPAALFVVLCFVLSRGVRGAAWLSFVVVLGSAAAAVAELVGGSPLPDGVFWAILALNLAAALTLFASIWKGREEPAV